MLLFENFPSGSPRASDFILGDNDEIFHCIQSLLVGQLFTPSIYIWSETGGGKSMLLHAARVYAHNNQLATYWLDAAATAEPVVPLAAGLWVVDNIDRINDDESTPIIQWLNHCHTQMDNRQLPHRERYFFLASGRCPPAQLAVDDEMSSRLAKGLVFRLRPLNDSEKKTALLKHAKKRGFVLPPEVVDLLLTYLPRNMTSLLAVLDDLDIFFLQKKRSITPARVRKWLRHHIQHDLF